MHMFLHFLSSLLSCSVEVEALRQAFPPLKESYLMPNSFVVLEVNSEAE
jgi:hypothetical protein